MNVDLKVLSRETLLNLLEEIAVAKYDGHVTLMRFTTHWKVMFGTPNLWRDDIGRSDVSGLVGYKDLPEAIRSCLQSNTRV